MKPLKIWIIKKKNLDLKETVIITTYYNLKKKDFYLRIIIKKIIKEIMAVVVDIIKKNIQKTLKIMMMIEMNMSKKINFHNKNYFFIFKILDFLNFLFLNTLNLY